ncbi:diguanylate cyclase/phosphodiesterase (GGDEF & EAL domains) with PAS/PAC sensor(s) [Candidatus Rhodobacter oscarellae]|uniref:Diguanylate cyclase/phosphodiesterase (GGDEF & EAL domains) with PAS/PAC sensor(S) n=1 Tax=Candidatus Rhodobacter oscarellae TaxID=1675527 RepID=A0A0J9E250_9RHOB|nr:GGDEF domain-containing protein [Candidatus Rhodobacter lobularis]KMW56805.1 diguanylate cyclase/phosphodiesterase (GGDEF & EAL domains) with PAS/PAC sensor(s) [Candidatus Rhodobacter lobularis]
MKAAANADILGMPLAALDALMPMHAIVTHTGHIRHAGPTLNKLAPGGSLEGTRFLEEFELRRPRAVSLIAELAQGGHQRLNLRLRRRDDIPVKGLAVPMPETGGILVNLSFGVSSVEAITAFDLSSADFAATDLAIELLYQIEVKNAVMEESRDLNMRLEGAKSAAEEQAHSDPLTGLKNRRAMELILARYRSCREKFSLIQMDLDHFKPVNDTMGHAAGDFVLRRAAQILLEETRTEDSVIRCGGDEFVLLLHRETDPVRLSKVAGRILDRLAEPIAFEDKVCQISGSMGITMSDEYSEIDIEQMMVDADVALYASKAAGRAQYTFVREIGGVGQSASSLSDAHPRYRTG